MWLQRLENWLIFDNSREIPHGPLPTLNQRGIVNRTVDGLHLRWYRFVTEIEAPVVVYAHGNGGSIDTREHIVNLFQETRKVNLVMFDYAGYGKSTGVASQSQILGDILTVYDYLVDIDGHPFGLENPLQPHQIIAWGESLGGAVVTYLAQRRQGLRGIVLMSTFPNLRWMARQLYGSLASVGFGWSFVDQLDTVQRLRDPTLTGPVIVLHSHDDDVVPISAAVELVQANPKSTTRFIAIKGTHQEPLIMPTTFREIWEGLGLD